MLSFTTVDNQHRQSFEATSLDEGFCVLGHGNGARFGAPVWGELLERRFQGQLKTTLATLTITDVHEGSSEVYGKIEEFMSPAV